MSNEDPSNGVPSRSRVFCIINPTGGGGKGNKVKPELTDSLRKEFIGCRIEETQCTGDGTTLARTAVREGFNVVIAVGGDGTLSEVIHGVKSEYHEPSAAPTLLASEAPPVVKDASFADGSWSGRSSNTSSGVIQRHLPNIVYLPCGTGADFARLGLGCKNVAEVVAAIKQPETKAVDVGCITYLQNNDEADALSATKEAFTERRIRGRRFFINITSIGLSYSVITTAERYKNNSCLRCCGGKAVFMAASAVELVKMTPRKFEIRKGLPFFPAPGDGEHEPLEDQWQTVSATNLSFANGHYFGGGMYVAPHGSTSDGNLDVVVWNEKFCGFLCGLPSVYNGKHLKWKSTISMTGPCWEVREPFAPPSGAAGVPVDTPSTVAFEVDGEKGQSLPAVVEICGTINFLQPSGHV